MLLSRIARSAAWLNTRMVLMFWRFTECGLHRSSLLWSATSSQMSSSLSMVEEPRGCMSGEMRQPTYRPLLPC